MSVLSVSAAEAGATNEESEAEALIAILADALESIVECTSDACARSIACEALVMFHGR